MEITFNQCKVHKYWLAISGEGGRGGNGGRREKGERLPSYLPQAIVAVCSYKLLTHNV